MNNIIIETKNLTKRFPDIIAVDSISLKVKKGEIFGLLGPNGSGKTTTVRMLNKLIEPTSGDANVGGYNIHSNDVEIKRICGLLPETPSLYGKLTVKEFLKFIGDLYNIPNKICISRISQLLNLFKLERDTQKLLENYSSGMKQKVSLCATLIHDPEIIFLDEPTSNLDPGETRKVKDLIRDLALKANKTIFICTHHLDIAEELCSDIGIINKGKLLIKGTPNEIIKSLNVNNLEEAYLKGLGIEKISDLLKWREE
ncbi:MAG: ABC transporter ATP-binding protein [Promethearchaeota archaeon]|nr:MAG: ABC transporter ATP-binding protein [Candidatus Lokiarchaeota archaeon]